MGPEDWEDHFGGTDEDIMEKDYERLVKDSYQENDSIDIKHIPYNVEEDNHNTNEAESPMSIQRKIVSWISKSKLAKVFTFRDGKGFFVTKGSSVQLKDGTVIEVIEWLFKNGICGGQTINNYNIVYTKPGGKYVEKLTFFRIIVNAPFFSTERENNDIKEHYNNISLIIDWISKSKLAKSLAIGIVYKILNDQWWVCMRDYIKIF
ncbi:MAG: hypothetical protein JETT_0935 [Candidatus Jettenia ecosi]|uniref:Uncharacterized protein n=1 Tax=Candidatus Jettenia ecosi TaxID=2494326 RepID=A0A533QJA2_9BACT|nr:MAG: hypothetical protein JETT_0935 [Candidatus Jettenia ecosi]